MNSLGGFGDAVQAHMQRILVPLLFFCSLYLEEGFLHLENAIGLSIIEFYASKTINLQVSVEVRE